MNSSTLQKKLFKIGADFIVVCALALYLIYKFSLMAFAKISAAGPDLLFAKKVAVLFGIFGVLGSCAFVGVYFLVFKLNIKIEKLFLIIFPAMSLVYLIIFLPGSVPDEPSHFYSAYKISNYLLFNFKQIGVEGTLVRADDLASFSSSTSTELSANIYANFVNSFKLFAEAGGYEEHSRSILTSGMLGHIAPAIGISIGRIFNLSLPMIFYFGRLGNIALYTLLVYRAIKITPFGKNFILVYSLLPMNLHLVASVSYDVLANSISVLIMAEFLSFYCGGKKVNLKDILRLAVLIALLAPTKLVYATVAAIPLLLKKEHFEEKYQKAAVWLKIILLGVAGISILLLQLPSFFSRGEAVTAGHYIAWAEEEGFTISALLSDPVNFLKIMLNTFRVQGDYYIHTAIGYSLGWLRVNTPHFAFFPFAVLFIISVLKEENSPAALRLPQKLWLLLLTCASGALVMVILLLDWTPISFTYIAGVQGRYFLPLVPMLFLMLRGDSMVINERGSKFLTLMTAFYSVYYISEVFPAAFV